MHVYFIVMAQYVFFTLINFNIIMLTACSFQLIIRFHLSVNSVFLSQKITRFSLSAGFFNKVFVR